VISTTSSNYIATIVVDSVSINSLSTFNKTKTANYSARNVQENNVHWNGI